MTMPNNKNNTACVGGKNPATNGPIRLARFTSDTGPLTKTLALGAGGRLVKGTAANLSMGSVENLTLARFDDFAEVLTTLEHNQALAYGISLRGDGPIMSEGRWDERGRPAGVLLRNREHFGWPSCGGLLMLDYDPPKAGDALTREQLLSVLYAAIPTLEDTAHVWRPSAGSHIWNAETKKEVDGLRGQRVYVLVADATDIPRIGQILEAKLWLARHGRYDISSAGSLLERTVVDGLVWQPERLDFAAGAKCELPLEQRRPAPLRLGGNGPLDSRSVPDLSETEIQRVERAKSIAKSAVREEAKKVRDARIQEKTSELKKDHGLDEKTAITVARDAFESGRLMGDFMLLTHDGKSVSVGDILDDPDTWNGARFHDPLDTTCEDERIAWVNLLSGGRPYLFSHAHGGSRYELCRTVATVQIPTGSTAVAVDQTLELMRVSKSYYERANAVVTVTERGEVLILGSYALKQKLERHIAFQKFDGRKNEMRPADCPDEIARRILDMRREGGLLPLGGVMLHPTMTATGRLLEKPGYDEETRLLLLNPTGRVWPHVPAHPSNEEVLAALTRLWAPVVKFPFVDDVSRGIALAALLTAVVRRSLPTAPAIMFAAPSAGSGKTLLGTCVVQLAGGAAAMPLTGDDGEIQKILVSLLRNAPGALFFDNVVGTVDSKALNAMLTSETYEGRILGHSETTGALPTNALVVLTGNNARPVGDMCRRMLVSTIDPKLEQPYLRAFSFNPLDLIRANKMELIISALTILRGWGVSDAGREARGGFASFDAWDRLVRQAVIWAGQLERAVVGEAAVGYGDPIANIQAQYAEDDESEALGNLLQAWAKVQEGDGFKAFELYRALDEARRGSAATAGLGEVGHALLEVMPKAQTSKGVSRWLKNVKGRIVHGLSIGGAVDPAANNTTWCVRRVAS